MKWSYPVFLTVLLLSALASFPSLAADAVTVAPETASMQPAAEVQPDSAPQLTPAETQVAPPADFLPTAPLFSATSAMALGCSGNPPPPGCECGFCCIDCGCWQTRRPVPCLAGP